MRFSRSGASGQINPAALRGEIEHAESSGNFESPIECKGPTLAVIDENEIGLEGGTERNGCPLARIKQISAGSSISGADNTSNQPGSCCIHSRTVGGADR